jgi:hypothetical protein
MRFTCLLSKSARNNCLLSYSNNSTGIHLKESLIESLRVQPTIAQVSGELFSEAV